MGHKSCHVINSNMKELQQCHSQPLILFTSLEEVREAAQTCMCMFNRHCAGSENMYRW